MSQNMRGSLINHLATNSPSGKVVVPVVGMGATAISWTDRHPFTVVEVINPKTVVLQEDNAERTDKNGMSDAQTYAFSPNPNGGKVTVTLRRNGKWVGKGEDTKSGMVYLLNCRDKYYDFSF